VYELGYGLDDWGLITGSEAIFSFTTTTGLVMHSIFWILINEFHYCKTESCGQLVNTPTSYLEGPLFDCWPQQPAILIEDFRGFPQSLKANARLMP
jgi:hypothetical protein